MVMPAIQSVGQGKGYGGARLAQPMAQPGLTTRNYNPLVALAQSLPRAPGGTTGPGMNLAPGSNPGPGIDMSHTPAPAQNVTPEKPWTDQVADLEAMSKNPNIEQGQRDWYTQLYQNQIMAGQLDRALRADLPTAAGWQGLVDQNGGALPYQVGANGNQWGADVLAAMQNGQPQQQVAAPDWSRALGNYSMDTSQPGGSLASMGAQLAAILGKR